MINLSSAQVRRARLRKNNALRDKNSQILHYLQFLLINTSLPGFSNLCLELNTFLHKTKCLLQNLHPLLPTLVLKLCGKLANKNVYQIGRIRLRLSKLQVEKQKDDENQGTVEKPYQVKKVELRNVETRKVKAKSESSYQVGGIRLWLQNLQVENQFMARKDSKENQA